MGITSKPAGKMKSIMRKLDNEHLRKAQEEKEKKKDGKSGKANRQVR